MSKNERGMTLIELSVAIAINSILALIMATAMTWMYKEFKSLNDKIDTNIDNVGGMQWLWKDLEKAFVSMGNYYVEDDFNKPFFDFYPDYTFPAGSTLAKSRKFTLSKAGDSFPIMVVDSTRGSPVFYDPVKAYDVDSTTYDQSMNSSQILSFKSVNRVSTTTSKGAVDSQNSMLWKEGTYILVYSPVWLRDFTASTTMLSRPDLLPKMPSFLGKISGSTLVGDEMKWGTTSHFSFAMPLDNKKSYLDIDDFFRNLSGVSNFVVLQAVHLVVYRTTDSISHPGKLNLYRWDSSRHTSTDQGDVISDQMTSLIFFRDDISSADFRFQML